MKKYVNKKYPHMLHGGDYNPDQWLNYPEILEQDMVMKNYDAVKDVEQLLPWNAPVDCKI